MMRILFKYYRLYFCTLCMLYAFTIKAQERTVLSYSSYSPKDSARVFALVREGLGLMDNEPAKAMSVFQNAEQISRLSGFDDGTGYALAFMGLAASQQGAQEQSHAYYKEAMTYCLNARECKFVIAYLYMNIGLSWKEKGDYSHANEYFHKALEAFRKYLPGEKYVTPVYINLIGIQARMGSYDKALAYADLAIQAAQADSKKSFLSLAILNKANTFQTMKQADSAVYYYRKGLKTAEELGDTKLYGSYYLGLGNIALQQEDNVTAIRYLNQVVQMHEADSTITLFGYILPRYSLGLAYRRQKAYRQAEKVLLEALAKAKETGLTENELDGHGVLADVYEETGRYKEAMEQATIYQQIRDSANQVEKIRAINEIEIKYRTEQKDKEIIQKKMMITRQEKAINTKNMIIAGSVGTAVLVLLSGFIFYRSKRKIDLRNAEILRLKAAANGEEQERSRISRELHDGLGGMLTGIKMNLRTLQKQEDTTTLPEKLDGIMDMLQGMGEEIRKTAHNLMPDVMLEYNLQQALQLYCGTLNTEQLRISLQFNGHLTIKDKSLELSIYRIVQELVQNIVKHAQATVAEIQVTQLKDKLCLSVEDNGVGFDSEQGQGIGLQNIKTRVSSLNGYYSLTSAPGKGTTAFIEIDLKNDIG